MKIIISSRAWNKMAAEGTESTGTDDKSTWSFKQWIDWLRKHPEDYETCPKRIKQRLPEEITAAGKKLKLNKQAMTNVLIFSPEPVDGFLIPVSDKYKKLLENIYGVSKIKASDANQARKRFEEDGFTMMLRNPDEIKPELL